MKGTTRDTVKSNRDLHEDLYYKACPANTWTGLISRQLWETKLPDLFFDVVATATYFFFNLPIIKNYLFDYCTLCIA